MANPKSIIPTATEPSISAHNLAQHGHEDGAPARVASGMSVSRRTLMNMIVRASAIATASPSIAMDRDDAELVRLGRQFDLLASEYIKRSQENSARHDVGVAASPAPATLTYTKADKKLGVPKPRWTDDPWHQGWDDSVSRRLRASTHPRIQEIIRESEAWANRRREAVDASGYKDSDPATDAAWSAAHDMHDRIKAIPAATIAGLQVKARVAYFARFGQISEDNCDIMDDMAVAILRELLAPQNLTDMTDFKFFESNPFA